MDRCALFVDAGYALGDGARAVVGTGSRDSVSWDFAGLVKLLSSLSTDRTGLPLLRCYWYDIAANGRRAEEHDAVADLPGVKVRLRKPRPGRADGVEAEICKDLTTLARNRAVTDVVIASAAEDVAAVIAEVQELGLRTLLLQVGNDANAAEARAFRQEFDEVIEISPDQLRPFVELIAGSEPQVAAASHREPPAVAIEAPAPRVISSPRAVEHGRAPELAAVSSGDGQRADSGVRSMPPAAEARFGEPAFAKPGTARAGNGNGGADLAADFRPGQQLAPQRPPADLPQRQLPAGSGPASESLPSVDQAIQSAHAEGFGFGQAVARDAPALWLEAVLARKPRMPSDLEAKLLQGSALPIDSLLHDDVRHALRRGFWDAMERSRR